jgi:predicted transcriptional regulator
MKRIFTLRLSDDDYDKMKIIAEHDNRSMANHIEKLVKREIAEYEAAHGEIRITEDE